MANRYLIKVDDVLQKEIKLEADITGLSEGNHVVKVESYQDTTLLDSKTKNISVTGAGPTYDPDYQTVLDYATANSITLPSTAIQETQNQIVLDLKVADIWDRLDALLMFEFDADTAFRLIDWKRLIQAASMGSIVWSSSGAKGNASNAYIDTKFATNNAVNLQAKNASMGIKIYDFTHGENQTIFGGREANNNNQTFFYCTSNIYYPRLNMQNIEFVPTIVNSNLNGFIQISNTNDVTKVYKNGVEVFSASASSGNLDPNNISLLALNSAGTRSLYSNVGISSWYAGAGLDDKSNELNAILG